MVFLGVEGVFFLLILKENLRRVEYRVSKYDRTACSFIGIATIATIVSATRPRYAHCPPDLPPDRRRVGAKSTPGVGVACFLLGDSFFTVTLILL